MLHSETGDSSQRQGWQELLQEATDALVRMDADRLEELVRCCEDLNRQQRTPQRLATTGRGSHRTAEQMRQERASLAVMGRLLEETRANLRVLTHLHVLRLKQAAGDAERWHAWQHGAAGAGMAGAGTARSGYGDN